ncbi:MAG TPA: diguanylate cyclase [Bryobacteraceae bacterium]|nr:diguanylate cyclase [Bryobacteraceae bacterium]
MKILAAEDNPVFQSMLRSILTKWGYEVLVARDGMEAWKILESADAPQLAILDWMMPGLDGVEICRRVRAAAREPYTYILLLTARTESQDLIEGMESGADDYVTKPLNTHELRVRLRAGSRIVELQQQLLLAREALREQATYDGLTGLYNRSSILELLQTELVRASREGGSIAVLMADLDRFKQINDTYGHMAGDAVLCEAGRRMKSAMRRYDAVGRYGGEEFLVVLSGCDAITAQRQAERLRNAVAGEPFHLADLDLPVTCSIGVSWCLHPEDSDVTGLVREADQALYIAKDRGRNRVETCSADLVTNVVC